MYLDYYSPMNANTYLFSETAENMHAMADQDCEAMEAWIAERDAEFPYIDPLECECDAGKLMGWGSVIA